MIISKEVYDRKYGVVLVIRKSMFVSAFDNNEAFLLKIINSGIHSLYQEILDLLNKQSLYVL